MVMEPKHANVYGAVHGGEIMHIMDTTAGCTAIKYANCRCVTAGVDEMRFMKPLEVGSFVTCTGVIVYTGKTSIEVLVTVDTENIRTIYSKDRAVEGFFTYVAIDKDGHPAPVPQFVPETEEEKELFERVRTRREYTRERREKIKDLKE